MSKFTSTDKATAIASATALMTIAFQVAGKAVRDTLFLSNYDVTALPVMLIATSAFSIVVVLLTSRAMARLTPARFVPLAFLTSAVLLLGEWTLAQEFPKAATVAVYLHIAALGGILISGFWSMVNERFDPRTAKKRVGLIGAGGAFGGLVGGVLAERVGATLSLATMLPILSLIHLLCAVLLVGLDRSLHAAHDRRYGRQVEDAAVDALECARQIVGVGHGAFDDLQGGAQPLEVLPGSRREVIDHRHGRAMLKQVLRQV